MAKQEFEKLKKGSRDGDLIEAKQEFRKLKK